MCVICNSHLLFHFLFDLLQVGSQVHGHFMFGAQQSGQHGIGRHPHFLQSWLLKLPLQILDHYLQVINLTDNGV